MRVQAQNVVLTKHLASIYWAPAPQGWVKTASQFGRCEASEKGSLKAWVSAVRTLLDGRLKKGLRNRSSRRLGGGFERCSSGSVIDSVCAPFLGVLTEGRQSTKIRDCFRWGTGSRFRRRAVGFQEVSRQGGLSICVPPSSDFLLNGPNVSSVTPRKRQLATSQCSGATFL